MLMFTIQTVWNWFQMFKSVNRTRTHTTYGLKAYWRIQTKRCERSCQAHTHTADAHTRLGSVCHARSKSNFTSDKPDFFQKQGALQMFVLGRSLGRTEPETAQPAVGHRGPQPVHHNHLLSASHIHGATALQELESSTGARSTRLWRSENTQGCCSDLCAPAGSDATNSACRELRLECRERSDTRHHSQPSPPITLSGDTPWLLQIWYLLEARRFRAIWRCIDKGGVGLFVLSSQTDAYT